jgi:fructokinase
MPTAETVRVAAVELGGTKVLATVGTDAEHHAPPIRLSTSAPESTLPAIVAALNALRQQGHTFDAIGVASFGPIHLDPQAALYGRLGATPKPGWAGVDVLKPLRDAFNLPIALETDVNAAALGEGEYAAAGCSDYAYITVGTGVGVGVVTRGEAVHGAGHPEAGHLLVRRRRDDLFAGACFAHGACVEGLISGPALEARLGAPASNLGADHPTWDLAGDYLAQLCMALVLTTAPQRIVLGGGVGARPQMLNAARRHLLRHLNGYIDRYQNQADIDALLVPAVLEHSGLIGALSLARAAVAFSDGWKRVLGQTRIEKTLLPDNINAASAPLDDYG